MPTKKRRLIANDNVGQFQRTSLAEYDETMQNLLIGLLPKDEGPEHRDLRELSKALDVEALK